MCLIQTGVVLARTDDAVVVACDGRERLVTSLLVPDLEVGDLVLIGLGTVFARTTAGEAADIDQLAATARGTAPIDDQPLGGT